MPSHASYVCGWALNIECTGSPLVGKDRVAVHVGVFRQI